MRLKQVKAALRFPKSRNRVDAAILITGNLTVILGPHRNYLAVDDFIMALRITRVS